MEKMNDTKTMIISYLQSMIDHFMDQKERYGMSEYLESRYDAMIACKEMTEALI